MPENEGDTRVGRLWWPAPAVRQSVTAFLIDGSGSNHNACFKIDGADLLTTKEFDHEAQSSLNIRVQTGQQWLHAGNAFTVAH